VYNLKNRLEHYSCEDIKLFGYAVRQTVRYLENASHTWEPQRCVHDEALYKSTFTLPYLMVSNLVH